MIFDCPGARDLKRPKPENIKCPSCGEEVEIWTDETRATCPKCKKVITRKQDLSCIEWCKYAKECVGEELYKKYLRNKKQN